MYHTQKYASCPCFDISVNIYESDGNYVDRKVKTWATWNIFAYQRLACNAFAHLYTLFCPVEFVYIQSRLWDEIAVYCYTFCQVYCYVGSSILVSGY